MFDVVLFDACSDNVYVSEAKEDPTRALALPCSEFGFNCCIVSVVFYVVCSQQVLRISRLMFLRKSQMLQIHV